MYILKNHRIKTKMQTTKNKTGEKYKQWFHKRKYSMMS